MRRAFQTHVNLRNDTIKQARAETEQLRGELQDIKTQLDKASERIADLEVALASHGLPMPPSRAEAALHEFRRGKPMLHVQHFTNACHTVSGLESGRQH